MVCDHVVTLFEAGILLPSSKLTAMPDGIIFIRFMGDKGGSFMSTKFGLTVMNCRDPNSPDSFDLCATLDAPDTYYNMKTGIFDNYKDELAFYFDLETPPKLLLLLLKECVLASFVFDIQGCTVDSLWKDAQTVTSSIESHPSSLGAHTGGPYHICSTTQMQLLEEDGLVWGLRLLDTKIDNQSVLRFRTPRVSSSLTKVTYKTFELHCVLGGDMAFLNTVLGLQSCSASFPCNLCMMRLSNLRYRKKDMHDAPNAPQARTKEQHQQHLANVMKESAPAKQREASKCNGSVIRPALVPAHFSRVLIAVLHIILGVTKKFFDNLTYDLQDIDSGGECGERMKLVQV